MPVLVLLPSIFPSISLYQAVFPQSSLLIFFSFLWYILSRHIRYVTRISFLFSIISFTYLLALLMTWPSQLLKVQFLRDIGVQQDSIGSVLVRFPRLLTFSLYKKIRPVVVFLLTKAGVSQRDIGKVIALGPELLGCSIANKLEHNVKYFLSLGITLRQLGEMVADFPMLLTYNIDILRPKYRYLRRMMVRPLQDLIEFPRFFSYSLDERIVPRHKIMVENRINFKLRYMLASTDDDFKQRVLTAVERRKRFESGVTYDEQEDAQIDCSMENLPLNFQTAEMLEENTNLPHDYKDLPTGYCYCTYSKFLNEKMHIVL